jgi:prepilin-type N-terminal cleavage/methylation domain-containing protein
MTRHRVSSAGFTLIELMIVVEILGIVVAVAIPSYMRNRVEANEASAVGSMHSILTAQIQFNAGRYTYGTFEQLSAPGRTQFLESSWSEGCTRAGYIYSMVTATASTFQCRATPVEVGRTGIRTYWIDESGQITWTE